MYFCTEGIINKDYKILTTNDTNILSSEDELLETPLVFSTDDTLPNPSWFLFQGSQFSTSIYITPITHSTVTSVTSILHSKEDSNHNKHDLKAEWREQLNAELKASKYFIREELCLFTRYMLYLQVQKVTPNHSVVTQSLKEELRYLRNENLTKLR